jgi:hypothetical protein
MIGAAGLAAKGLPAEDGRRRLVDTSLVGKRSTGECGSTPYCCGNQLGGISAFAQVSTLYGHTAWLSQQ